MQRSMTHASCSPRCYQAGVVPGRSQQPLPHRTRSVAAKSGMDDFLSLAGTIGIVGGTFGVGLAVSAWQQQAALQRELEEVQQQLKERDAQLKETKKKLGREAKVGPNCMGGRRRRVRCMHVPDRRKHLLAPCKRATHRLLHPCRSCGAGTGAQCYALPVCEVHPCTVPKQWEWCVRGLHTWVMGHSKASTMRNIGTDILHLCWRTALKEIRVAVHVHIPSTARLQPLHSQPCHPF